jgi:O-Antigen ligase
MRGSGLVSTKLESCDLVTSRVPGDDVYNDTEVRSPQADVARRAAISCFTAFLGAGTLKSTVDLPVDLTLLLAVLSAAACLSYGVIHGIPKQAKLPIWLFAAAGFTMLPFTESTPEYCWWKALYFFTLTALAVFGPFFLIRNSADMRWFLLSLSAVCATVALIALYELPAAVKHRIGQEHTIVVGRCCGLLLLWLVATSLETNGIRWWRVLVGTLFAFILVGSGSRAPLILCGLTLLLMAFLVGSTKRKIAGVVALCVLAGAVYLCLPMLPQRSVERILAFENMQEDKSTSERISLWSVASTYMENHPAGLGFGGFWQLYPTDADRVYPHNIVLEMGVEGGWLMAGAMVAYIGFGLRRVFKQRQRWHLAAVLFALALYLVGNAMVSGDMNDNRMMWAMLTLCWR